MLIDSVSDFFIVVRLFSSNLLTHGRIAYGRCIIDFFMTTFVVEGGMNIR